MTVVIGSISRLTGIKIIRADGSEELIAGDTPRHITMSGEARSFYNFVTNSSQYRKEYEYASKLAIEVCGAMEPIRKQAGIRFEQDIT